MGSSFTMLDLQQNLVAMQNLQFAQKAIDENAN
jgi:hypothetical protein